MLDLVRADNKKHQQHRKASGVVPCSFVVWRRNNLGSRIWGAESVFRPQKRMSSHFLLKRGVQMPYLFHENQTPRSDAANLEPSEPVFCPQILEPREQPLAEAPCARAARNLRGGSGMHYKIHSREAAHLVGETRGGRPRAVRYAVQPN